MSTKHFTLKLVIASLLIISSLAGLMANTMVHNEDKTVETRTIEHDYFFGGNQLDFSGTAKNLYYGGRRLTFNGTTTHSIFAAGRRLDIDGTTGNNLHLAGQWITISGKIDGNVMIAGEDVIIEKDAVITGTLFVASSDCTILGTVNGDIYAAAGFLTISGTIDGNVNASTGKISLTESAVIGGNLTYHSDREISEGDRGKIKGEISWSKPERNNKQRTEKHSQSNKKAMAGMKIVFTLFTLISFIIGGLLLLLFPITKKLEEPSNTKKYWFSSLWGLIPFAIYPVANFMLLIIGITTPLGIIITLICLPLLFLTQIIGVTITGQYLFSLFKWDKPKRHLYFLFGCIAYVIIMLIPLLNVLGIIFFSSLGWGVLLRGIFQKDLV